MRGFTAPFDIEVAVQVVGERREVLHDRLVAADQPVVGEHRRHRDDEAERGHDQRFADRAGDDVDRGLARRADLDQRAVDADDGTEQADERSGRTDGREEGEAFTETRADRALAAGQAVGHPVVLVDRIGQLAVLVLGDQRIVDDRAIGAARFELGRGLAKVRRVPEAGADLAALADDLLLLHQLGEQDVETEQRHERPG